MGTFSVTIQIGDPQGQNYESAEALVDTGASDTVVPRSVLERLGVPVQGRWPFALADDRIVEHDIGQTAIRIDGISRIVLVVFGNVEGSVLLGASSLEVFHLAADTVNRRLIPVPGLLKGLTPRAKDPAVRAGSDGSALRHAMNPEHVQVAKKGIIAIDDWNSIHRGERLDLSGADQIGAEVLLGQM